MFTGIINKLKTIRLWHLLWISLILSELFTAVMNTIMGLIWWGRIDIDLLLIGVVDAFFVSLAMSTIIILIFREIKNVEKSSAVSLEATNVQLMSLINTIPDMVIFKDTAGRHVIVNKAVEEVAGHAAEEIIGKTIEDMLPPEPAAACRKSDEGAMGRRTPTHAEEVIPRQDGSVSYFDMVKAPMVDDLGNTVGLVAVGRDVTRNKEMERSLRESEERFRALFDTATDAIFILDLEGKLLDVNRAAHERLGYTKEQMLAMNVAQLDHERYRATVPDRINRMKDSKPLVTELEHVTKDGRIIPVEINARMVDLTGRPVIFGIVRDITERKRADEQIKRSLNEKEVLLKEIHHRVKNNMQVIYSLLNLQAKGIADKTVRAMIEEARNRVHSMALIHEKLYGSSDLAHIEFKEYLKDLVFQIADTYRKNDVDFSVDMEPLLLDVNVGIPCGLIVNELVSNSFKYAFTDGRKGSIKVGINVNGEGNYVLTVEDNGIGLPETLDFQNSSTLGLQLVNVLSEQIRGKIQLSKKKGTEFSITFPGTSVKM